MAMSYHCASDVQTSHGIYSSEKYGTFSPLPSHKVTVNSGERDEGYNSERRGIHNQKECGQVDGYRATLISKSPGKSNAYMDKHSKCRTELSTSERSSNETHHPSRTAAAELKESTKLIQGLDVKQYSMDKHHPSGQHSSNIERK